MDPILIVMCIAGACPVVLNIIFDIREGRNKKKTNKALPEKKKPLWQIQEEERIARGKRIMSKDLEFFDFETDLVSTGLSHRKKFAYLDNRQAMRDAITQYHEKRTLFSEQKNQISIYSPDKKKIRLELFGAYMNDYEYEYAVKYCLFTKGATRVSLLTLNWSWK